MPINYWLERLYALALLLVALKFKIAVTLRDFAERQSSYFLIQAVLFLIPSLLLWTLLRLLFHISTDSLLFARSIHSEIQSASLYAKNLVWFVNLIVDWFVCYAILRWSARGAWLWLWLVYEVEALALAIGMAEMPLHLPQFYSPLTAQRPALAKMVQAAELRHAVKVPPISIMVDSSDTGSFAGSVGVARYFSITLSQGMLKTLDDSQLLFVVGHELGHIADGLREVVFRACVSFVWISFSYALAIQMITWCGPRLGIRGVQDWAGLPIFAICFVVFGAVTNLGFDEYQQHMELRADCFAVGFTTGEVEHPVDVAQSALVKMQPRNDSGWRSFRLGPASHPSLAMRVLSLEACENPGPQ
jgi:Zn-dependent protease with chaperone function